MEGAGEQRIGPNLEEPLGGGNAGDRAGTGIPGLDEILRGGFLRRQVHLVEGAVGTGKTTLALQYLLEGLRRGERCLFVSFSETRQELERTAAGHGWSLDRLVIHEPRLFHGEGLLEEDYSIFHPREVELDGALRGLLDEVDRVRPTRAVFDPISGLRLLSDHPLRYRREVLALSRFFIGKDCTVLLTDDISAPSDYQLRTRVHSVVQLHQRPEAYGADDRQLRVVKARGTDFLEGCHDMDLRRGGILVFPRLMARPSVEPPDRSQREATFLASGLPALDALLGGGLTRGSSTLFLGPAGTGKSTLAGLFAAAAAREGERSLVFTFEEDGEGYLKRLQALGVSLREGSEGGRIDFRAVRSMAWTPGELSHQVRRAVEGEGLGLLVLDSLNGYLRAQPQDFALRARLRDLLSFLAPRGVVTLLTATQRGVLGEDGSRHGPEATYLADAVVLLRYFEAEGSVRKAISVMKKRTGRHERTIRELHIGDGEIGLSAPLEEFRGVLTGVPTFTGEIAQLADGGDQGERG